MLAAGQINEIHSVALGREMPLRKIARHLYVGRRTIAKHLETPAPARTRRDRARKVDPFKPAIDDLLRQRSHDQPAGDLAIRLRPPGCDGGVTIIEDYLLRCAPAIGRRGAPMSAWSREGFGIDWEHFGALVRSRKLYVFSLS